MRNDPIAPCAALVERADPDRFRATMAAPPAARRVLFPLFAFNVEIARAPWVSSEPAIARMRMQWWRDALVEIGSGGAVRRHEIVTPLAELLTPDCTGDLDQLIVARHWDIENLPFENSDGLLSYLDRTTGNLLWVAARALGATDPVPVRAAARAFGLANWLLSVPDWRARGRHPLPDAGPEAIAGLARVGRDALAQARRGAIPRPARAALLAGWQSGPVLRRAASDPARVEAGTLRLSPARARAMLIWHAASGRI